MFMSHCLWDFPQNASGSSHSMPSHLIYLWTISILSPSETKSSMYYLSFKWPKQNTINFSTPQYMPHAPPLLGSITWTISGEEYKWWSSLWNPSMLFKGHNTWNYCVFYSMFLSLAEELLALQELCSMALQFRQALFYVISFCTILLSRNLQIYTNSQIYTTIFSSTWLGID
jgi:hypothetical protein